VRGKKGRSLSAIGTPALDVQDRACVHGRSLNGP
jgi:hypothetical protein